MSHQSPRLVPTYPRHGDTVADSDHDRNPRSAAAAASPAYVAVTSRNRLADPDPHKNTTSPVVIRRWPDLASANNPHGIHGRVLACRPAHVTNRGRTRVTHIQPGQTGTTHDKHPDALLAGVTELRFTHVERVLTPSIRGGGHRYASYATAVERRREQQRDTTTVNTFHNDDTTRAAMASHDSLRQCVSCRDTTPRPTRRTPHSTTRILTPTARRVSRILRPEGSRSTPATHRPHHRSWHRRRTQVTLRGTHRPADHRRAWTDQARRARRRGRTCGDPAMSASPASHTRSLNRPTGNC